MDEVIPTIDDLRSIFDDPTIGIKTDSVDNVQLNVNETPVNGDTLTISDTVTIIDEGVIPLTEQEKEIDKAPLFENPANDISQEVKTITPELSDEEVAKRLQEAEISSEVGKGGESETVSPQVEEIAQVVTLDDLRNEDGTLRGGIPQETNKNGTAGSPGFDEEKEKEIVQKLREAFMFGCTDREACLFADVSKSWLYVYQQSHLDFVDQKEDWKDNPKLKARKNIHEAIQKGDADVSQWYLEHKANKEFSKRAQMTGGDDVNSSPIKIEYVIPKSDK